MHMGNWVVLQISPLGISFLKGHMGITEILLDQPGVDINFKNEDGKDVSSVRWPFLGNKSAFVLLLCDTV